MVSINIFVKMKNELNYYSGWLVRQGSVDSPETETRFDGKPESLQKPQKVNIPGTNTYIDVESEITSSGSVDAYAYYLYTYTSHYAKYTWKVGYTVSKFEEIKFELDSGSYYGPVKTITGVSDGGGTMYGKPAHVDPVQLTYSYYEYQWEEITVDVHGIFSPEDDRVSFKNLSTIQKTILSSESDTNIYNALNGSDFVVLPDVLGYQLTAQVKWNPGRTLNTGGGDDYVIGGNGNDLVDGGSGFDTFKLHKAMDFYTIGGNKTSGYGHLYVKGADGKIDIIDDVENLKFSDRDQLITKWAQLISISSINNINIGSDGKKLNTPAQDYMISRFGKPADGLTSSPDTHPKDGMSAYAWHMIGKTVIAGKTVYGLEPLIDSLETVLSAAKNLKLSGESASLFQSISSEGMAVPRLQAGSTQYSNHTWGTAIDLKIDGILDHADDGKVHKGIAKLIELFNKAGWVSGSVYSREDSMHFEASKQLLEKLFPSKMGSAAADKLVGGDNHDMLVGNAGNDILKGNAGNDLLKGGHGRDFLAGGAGKDVFVFDTKLGPSNVDKIDDFHVKDDTIWLDKAIFTKMEKGSLSASEFCVGVKAKDASDHIIYDSETGKLWYDADGSGNRAAYQFALIDKGLKVTAADFFAI